MASKPSGQFNRFAPPVNAEFWNKIAQTKPFFARRKSNLTIKSRGIIQVPGDDGHDYELHSPANLVDWISLFPDFIAGGVLNQSTAPRIPHAIVSFAFVELNADRHCRALRESAWSKLI